MLVLAEPTHSRANLLTYVVCKYFYETLSQRLSVREAINDTNILNHFHIRQLTRDMFMVGTRISRLVLQHTLYKSCTIIFINQYKMQMTNLTFVLLLDTSFLNYT